MRTNRVLLTGVAVVALLATACSDGTGPGAASSVRPSGSAQAAGEIAIEMVDIAFAPKTINVARGKPLTFVFTNNGKVVHDAYIGDAAAQGVHEKEMRESAPGAHHEDALAAIVQPGQVGKLTQTFDTAGTFEIGCHQAGHFAAGMRMSVVVT